MKTLITLTALALATGIASAQDFAYERQIGSPDVSAQPFHATDPMPSQGKIAVSLEHVYRGNPDVETLPADYREQPSRTAAFCNSSYDRIALGNSDLYGTC